MRVFPFVFVIIALNVGLSRDKLTLLFPLVGFINIILPIFIFFWLKSLGEFKSGMTRREERYRFFGLLAICYFISTIVLLFWGNNLSFVLNLILFILTATIWLVTFKFKLSGHMAWNGAMIFVINFLFGWSYFWLFLLLAIIGFSRVYLKKHTFEEVLVGAIVGLVEPYLILKFFKLL